MPNAVIICKRFKNNKLEVNLTNKYNHLPASDRFAGDKLWPPPNDKDDNFDPKSRLGLWSSIDVFAARLLTDLPPVERLHDEQTLDVNE
uniref:Uncharacterized protein n=1 Tax=Romanomermis culicivorax TaxID=13658 RepID=A0A915KEK6_ROMCU